jgi:TolB protein
MPAADMPSQPHEFSEINFDEWRGLGREYLVVGNVTAAPTGGYQVEFRLIDVYRGNQLLGFRIPTPSRDLRLTAHQISDLIYEKILGMKGAFATRIAYITVKSDAQGNRIYELQIADADGYNPHTLVSAKQPLMSPAWSPDGKRLAYVSFEQHNSAIYVQDIETGYREAVASGPGINSAPAWSPDGQKLAVTLSRDGDPEIYILHLLGRRLQRITHDPAIDTEPAWSPDGRTLVFTSDRGGKPQIYHISISGGEPKRLTHEGHYNARASFSSDGRSLTLVHGEGNSFRIAVLDLDTRQMRVLTDASLDESPSFAPNGSMIIYATVGGSGTELAATSVDGRVRQRLAFPGGEVREPSWGPLRKYE